MQVVFLFEMNSKNLPIEIQMGSIPNSQKLMPYKKVIKKNNCNIDLVQSNSSQLRNLLSKVK